MRRAALGLAFAAIAGLSNAAPLEPAMADLRAAYCARTLRAQQDMLSAFYDDLGRGPMTSVAVLRPGIATQLSELRARHDRILAYLRPRMENGSFARLQGLDAASRQADADASRIKELQSAAGCSGKGFAETASCLEKVKIPAEISAARAHCVSLDWLPF